MSGDMEETLFYKKRVCFVVCFVGKQNVFVMAGGNDKALSFLEECFGALYPFRRSLCGMLRLPELVGLSLTSSVFWQLLGPEVRESLEIERFLSSFFKDSGSFRMMLKDTGGVVYGDFCESFFMRDCFSRSLDILLVDPCLYSGKKIDRWICYLTKKEDYILRCMGGWEDETYQVLLCV